MAFSYSFHISSKSHAVSTTKKVAQVSRHNLREYKKSSHYDPTLIQILQGSESSILDSVKQIYHNEFDAALEIYNSGKRPDRQIQDYLKHVSDSRSDVACEIIIQLGDKDFWETKSLARIMVIVITGVQGCLSCNTLRRVESSYAHCRCSCSHRI